MNENRSGSSDSQYNQKDPDNKRINNLPKQLNKNTDKLSQIKTFCIVFAITLIIFLKIKQTLMLKNKLGEGCVCEHVCVCVGTQNKFHVILNTHTHARTQIHTFIEFISLLIFFFCLFDNALCFRHDRIFFSVFVLNLSKIFVLIFFFPKFALYFTIVILLINMFRFIQLYLQTLLYTISFSLSFSFK